MEFRSFEIYKKNIRWTGLGILLIFLGILLSPQIKIGFGGLDTSQNPEIKEMMSCGFSNKKTEILLDQNEAE